MASASAAEIQAATQPGAPVTGRLDALTSMRWFAALGVFGVHFDAIAGSLHGMSTSVLRSSGNAVTNSASTGVSFFFVLSGFVLTWSQLNRARPKAVGPFLRDRVARIFPNHLVTSALALALIGSAGIAVTAVPAVFLLQAWIPRQRYFFALNVPSWTLSCEMFFYLCFPLALSRLRGLRARRALLAGLVAVSFGLAFIHAALPASTANFWVYIFPPSRLPEFLIGILLALEIRDGSWRRVPLLPSCALVIAVVVFEEHLPVGFRFAAATLIPVMLVVLATAGADLRGAARVLHNRWLIRLGEWSFAFYIVHNLVVLEFARRANPYHWPSSDAFPLVLAAALVVVSIAAAAALHHLVEIPAQRLLTGGKRGGRLSL